MRFKIDDCEICGAKHVETRKIRYYGTPLILCRLCLSVKTLLYYEQRAQYDKAAEQTEKIKKAVAPAPANVLIRELKQKFSEKNTESEFDIVDYVLGDLL